MLRWSVLLVVCRSGARQLARSGSFRKLGVPYLGVLIMRILLCRVLYSGPLFSETPYGFKTLDSKCWYIVSEFRSPKSVQIFGFIIADTIIPKFVKCTQPGSLQSAPSLFMGCYTTQSYGSGFEVHAPRMQCMGKRC